MLDVVLTKGGDEEVGVVVTLSKSVSDEGGIVWSFVNLHPGIGP